MRRGINIRKKKRVLLNESNKKCLKILFLLSIILIVCTVTYIFFIQNIFIKRNFEKDNVDFSNLNENIPFSLNKIILFSSATAESSTINQQLSLNISQYCDIGIYLNNTDKENSILKSLYINNISVSKPELGTPYIYKKRISELGKSSFNEENIVENEFYFNIIKNTDKINYDNYELLDDGTTPISLGFYNKDVKKDFIIDEKELIYNGTLLKKALIQQSKLNCNVSFSINIITNDDKHYICNISFDIPFENEKLSIYNKGYITKEIPKSEIGSFIRIK